MFSNLSKMVLTKRNLMILLLVIALVTVSYLVYIYVVLPKVSPTFVQNNEFEGGNSEKEKEAEIMFFYVNWCPHCKTAKPIWQKVKDTYHGKVVNGTKVYFKEIDCEKNEDMADKYKVDGYPTIKLVKENEIIEFNAKPRESSLTQFLDSTL